MEILDALTSVVVSIKNWVEDKFVSKKNIDATLSETSTNPVCNKAVTTEINARFGAVETALDYIWNMQNELIGIITFTIRGEEYHATQGMTWEEWVNSPYNTDYYVIDENGYLNDGDYTFIYDDGTYITATMSPYDGGVYGE